MTNPFINQFKLFFSKSYSKPFVVLCALIITSGALYSLYTVSDLRKNIDAKITQRQEELGKLFDEQDAKNEAEYQAALEIYNRCLAEFKQTRIGINNLDYTRLLRRSCGFRPYTGVYIIWGNRYPVRYLQDSYYRELTRIKNTSDLQLFFEKLSFGWWGVIALAAVLIINILIILIKFLKTTIFMFIRVGNNQAILAKNNINNMPAFQKYLLLIAVLTLATLVFILIKL